MNANTESIRKFELYYNSGMIYVMLESYYQWIGAVLLPSIAAIMTFIANIF